MITHAFLLQVLTTEALIFAAITGLLLLNACRRTVRVAWLRPRVRETRDIVSRVLAGGAHPAASPSLPTDQALRVLADAGRSVDEAGRVRLRGLPVYDRLACRAERWCRSRSWYRRLKGVRLLTVLGTGERAVPPLLDDPRAHVRSAAAAWTGRHASPGGADRLVRMLDDDALSCRLTAQASLIRLGSHAVPSLVHHLENPEAPRLAAALLVGARLNEGTLQGPALAHRQHADADVRAAVAEVLTSSGGAEAITALEAFLDDRDPTVRATAAAGLGELGHWPSAPFLAERLADRAWEVRRAAGIALSRLGGPGQLYLQRALRSGDPFAGDMARQILDSPVPSPPGQGRI